MFWEAVGRQQSQGGVAYSTPVLFCFWGFFILMLLQVQHPWSRWPQWALEIGLKWVLVALAENPGSRSQDHMELTISHNRGANILFWPPQAPCIWSTYIHANQTLIFTEQQQTSSRITKLVFQTEENSGLTLWIPIWVNIINYSWVLSEDIANSWKTKTLKMCNTDYHQG